jgi:hypothetical protein
MQNISHQQSNMQRVMKLGTLRWVSFGLGASVVLAAWPSIQYKYGQHMIASAKRDQLAYNASVNQTWAMTQRATSDVFKEHGVVEASQFVLQGYTYSPGNLPPRDFMATVNPNQRTRIFDQGGVCVGEAYQGLFYLVGSDPNVCKSENPG